MNTLNILCLTIVLLTIILIFGFVEIPFRWFWQIIIKLWNTLSKTARFFWEIFKPKPTPESPIMQSKAVQKALASISHSDSYRRE
jgi:hypothetical protein